MKVSSDDNKLYTTLETVEITKISIGFWCLFSGSIKNFFPKSDYSSAKIT